ncbi:MAG: hypothetical protein IPP88_25335 [Betaproteobacteria bacterium]|nr:hypothetical protein [Betaproteobacteria bacterium]
MTFCKCALLLLALLVGISHEAHPAVPKTIRFAFLVAETTFDPVTVSDLYSNTINEAIFDPLLTYDFLARPVKLVPNTAAALPEITDEGKIYTFKIKPGIYFADDAAFGGTKRELTAHDYAYTLKRLFDPKNRSPWLWYVEGKIIGGDEAAAAAKKSGKFDYDQPIAGIETPDKYTLRLRLKDTDYNFIYIFATPQSAAMAREVVEKYLPDAGSHPVGTGPFRIAEWKRSHKIVLEANPGFREVFYRAEPGADTIMQAAHARMNGKKLPQVQRIEVTIVEESQPRWLAFLNGETDYANAPVEFAGSAFPGGKLAPNLAKQGIRASGMSSPISCTRTSISITRWSVASRPKRSRCAVRLRWHTTITRTSTSFAMAARSRRSRRCRLACRAMIRRSRLRKVTYDPPRARIARYVRLHRSGWRWLSRNTGWQAASR